MLNISKHIDNEWSHLKDKNIFVSCSGGVDSIVLAWILNKINFKVKVIHINYKLRSKESDLDALFIKSFCEKHQITCLEKTINLKGKKNIQERARNHRYKWFRHIIAYNQDNYIALGHHKDDQIETFFLNITRNSGIMGLACMLKEHNNIIRPLLDYNKNEIIEYAKLNEIKWREDSSNKLNNYRRNILRNIIIPEIKSNNINIGDSVITLIQAFQKTQKKIEKKITPISVNFIEKGYITINKLKTLNTFELIEFLRQLNQPSSNIDELIKLYNTQKGKKIKWGNNWLINEGDRLLEKKELKKKLKFVFKVEKIKLLPNKFNKDEIYLDSNKVSGLLQLRNWDIGDRIFPIGMKGSKLVSDIISDAKLTSQEKESVMILHDDKNIHWCVGLTIGRKAIAEENSKNIIKVTVS